MSANPKLYREMSEPFASMEESQKASDAFQEDLGELRKKHRMRDIVCVTAFSYLLPDGTEGDAILTGSYGSFMMHETMLAYALGMVQSERQSRIAALLARGLKKGRRDD